MSDPAPNSRDVSLLRCPAAALMVLVLYALCIGPVHALATRGFIKLETCSLIESTVYLPVADPLCWHDRTSRVFNWYLRLFEP